MSVDFSVPVLNIGGGACGAVAALAARDAGADVLPAPALAATIAEAHNAQRQGGPDAFGRIWGTDQPPVPPFRALRVTGALYHAQGGLRIDGEARVLRHDLRRFPNLFAGGGTACSVSGPSSWGYLPAMGFSTAVTLGWLAGTSAARLISETADRNAIRAPNASDV